MHAYILNVPLQCGRYLTLNVLFIYNYIVDYRKIYYVLSLKSFAFTQNVKY